ncbi:MAG: DegT/DnrJ/EryC1/StrS family aminotransferase [Bacteroidales bacterium]|nr:DegT/DnrJ/EryC1/StrS family aminotransferase [Candidatus Liminaster caballi]
MNYLDLHAINAPYEPQIKQALLDVVDSGWYLFGKQVCEFEKEWAAYNEAKHCVACANGLDALRLVMKAWIEMGLINEGDEVIVPANTYIATILAVSDNGLCPLPVDADPLSYVISVDKVKALLNERIAKQGNIGRIRAILPVHLYGTLCDMKALAEIAESHNLLMLQDCAQCHGQQVSGTCAWSFYPGKNLGALGDAGAITTDDEALAETIRRIAFYGSSRKYIHQYKGLNSRMDEMQAAVLRIKLKDLDRCNRRRQEIAMRYINEISNPHVVLPQPDSVFHIFPLLCDDRDALQKHLLSLGIQTQIHYPIPPHRQEAYKEWADLHFPVAEHISEHELSLPCHPAMSDEDVQTVIEGVMGMWNEE